MRVRTWSAVLIAASGVIPAQLNAVELYPDATTFTSRSGIPPNTAGDLIVKMDRANILGEGQGVPGTNAGRVNGFRFLLQDQNAATTETYNLTVLADSGGQPDTTPAGVLLRTGALQSPIGTGTVAWMITVGLTTPADVLPATRTWYFGAGLPASPTFPADGLSVHGAAYATGTMGDNPRAGAPNVTYAVARPAGIVLPQVADRTHRFAILTQAPALGVGADIVASAQRGPNPNFGVAGIYPDTANRRDGLALRIRDIGNANGFAHFLIGFRILSTPLTIPGIEGRLFLDPTVMFYIGSVQIPPSGEAVFQPAFLGQGAIPTSVSGPVGFQALVQPPGGGPLVLSTVVTPTTST